MAEKEVEICLFWGDWQIQNWWSCMDKSDWAAWAQVAGVLTALFMPFMISWFRSRRERKIVKNLSHYLKYSIEKLKAVAQSSKYVERDEAQANYIDMLAKFAYFKEPLPLQVSAISAVAPIMAIRLLNAVGAINSRKAVVEHLRERSDIVVGGHLYLHLQEQSNKLSEEVKEFERIDKWIECFFVNDFLVARIFRWFMLAWRKMG
jgi:hypothetical protein